MRRRVGFRWVVAALVLAVVAPLTVLGSVGLERTWRRQLANMDRQNIATVRAISVAVDQEVQGTTAALNVLGELHALDAPDLPAFESLAGRLLPYQPTWSAILLSDTSGAILDGVPDRSDGGAHVGGDSWARATVRGRSVAVSNLFELPNVPGHFVMISVPVVRSGRAAFVLGARVRSDGFSAIMRRQEAPPNGAVTLVDAFGRIIARTKEEETYVGTSVTKAFAEFTAHTDEGSGEREARNGTTNYTSFSRSPRTGLVVALGVPSEVIDGPIRRLLGILSLGWVLVIGSGAGLGFLLGGVIVRNLSAASRASVALARDEHVALPRSRITEIDDLAMGLRDAAAALHARNLERDEAARVKDEFLMTVSHELRTPLTAILGWARMLSTGQIRDSQRSHAIAAIERNANALHQLVNDLLDVSRVMSGNLRLDVQAVSLADIAAAAVDSLRPAADAKGITISAHLDANLPVRGDAGRLQQVMWNLLSNAVKFTPGGGRIDVDTERLGGYAIVKVRDTGCGIAPGFLPHVFERFRQGESGTTRARGGLGLGLAIVRHLVELHGGTVSAENNTPPPGATFCLRVPLRVSSASPGAGDAGRRFAAGGIPAARLDNVHVLVVDDDMQSRELFTTILANAGARVRAAASADDAVALLAMERPDVLLSDIEMPNQDGFMLLRRVRAMDTADRRLAAIAVTAHARPEDRTRALDNGFAWHLAKPIEPDELVKAVAMVVEAPTVH